MEAYSSSSSATSRHQTPHFSAALHAVRRSGTAAPVKPWKKPAVAPLPPTPPRVYKVDPINFRDLVQRLTAAPEFSAGADSEDAGEERRLHALAPPPVRVAPDLTGKNPPASLSAVYNEFSEALAEKKSPSNGGGFLGLNLSPIPVNTTSSHGWCSYPLLSPGTLSNFQVL